MNLRKRKYAFPYTLNMIYHLTRTLEISVCVCVKDSIKINLDIGPGWTRTTRVLVKMQENRTSPNVCKKASVDKCVPQEVKHKITEAHPWALTQKLCTNIHSSVSTKCKTKNRRKWTGNTWYTQP